MKKTNWKDIAELIGIAAIVASLVFVGLQMRQSQEIALATQYQSRYELTLDLMTQMTDSEAKLIMYGKRLQRLIPTNPNASDELKSWVQDQPAGEVAYWSTFEFLRMKHHENLHYQYQSGFLDDESWQALHQSFSWQFDDPGIAMDTRAAYQLDPEGWRTSFRELIEELMSELDARER